MSDIIKPQEGLIGANGLPLTKADPQGLTAQNLTPWERFCFDLVGAVREATQTGRGARLKVGDKFDVTVDVYVDKAQVKKLDKLSNKQQAERLGMKVVKDGKKESDSQKENDKA